MDRVVLRKGKARPFWYGNPIVFSGSIEEVTGDPRPGDLVEVCDADGRILGHGFYNPSSSYRVRIVRMHRAHEPAPKVQAVLSTRLFQAWRMRAALGLPSPDTNCLRLVNSEGDGLSGLTVDLYDRTAVQVASAIWVQRYRSVIDENLQILVPGVRTIHRVSSAVVQEEGLSEETAVQGEGPVEVLEGGIRYLVDVTHGQKTGFYLDQRDNRALVRSLAAGRRVLDAFCFTGGFAISAARGGAKEVFGVDSSGPAIALARENAARNGCTQVHFEEGDAETALGASASYDMVILDPPKLARSHKDLDAARNHYRRLNREAMIALSEGGILVTCSCSSAMRREDFLEVLRDAAREAHRRITVTHVRGAAPDHPINPSWMEGEYLKCVVAVVH